MGYQVDGCKGWALRWERPRLAPPSLPSACPHLAMLLAHVSTPWTLGRMFSKGSHSTIWLQLTMLSCMSLFLIATMDSEFGSSRSKGPGPGSCFGREAQSGWQSTHIQGFTVENHLPRSLMASISSSIQHLPVAPYWGVFFKRHGPAGNI